VSQAPEDGIAAKSGFDGSKSALMAMVPEPPPSRLPSGGPALPDSISDPAGSPSSRRLGQFALISALLALGIWIIWDFLPALVWAVVVAIAIWPLVERSRLRQWNRTAAAAEATLLIGVVVIVPLIILGTEIGREAVATVQWVREAERAGIPPPEWLAQLPLIGGYVSDWWTSNLSEPLAAANLLGRIDRNWLIEWTRILGFQLIHRLTILIFTFLTLFFLFRDGERLVQQTWTVVDRFFGATGTRLGPQVLIAVRATVNGLVLVGFGEGLLLGVAYAISGLPRPVLLGALTGVLATVPFGAPLVFGLGALVLFSQSQTGAAVALLAFGSIVVFVADHFLRPILIGGAARLPFLWVLLGIFGGLESFGLLGLFLGPTIMAVLLALWRDWAEPVS
jgi:predicted PurR-regulated permease PerM